MYIRNCGYCGREYAAKNSRSRYCCDRCRNYARRYQITGRELKTASRGVVGYQVKVKPAQVARAITDIRGGVATLDAASLRGTDDCKEVCLSLSTDIKLAFKKVGL